MRRFVSRASITLTSVLCAAALPLVAGCDGDSGTGTGGAGGTGGTTSAPADVFGPLGQRDDLPVDEKIQLENLSGPVDVVRDKWGRPHIFASSVADAVRVQGYVMVKDRGMQMELLRRISEGRMAEILGQTDPTQIDRDISLRHIGLHRVAKKQWEAMPDGETKTALEAFSDGVTQAYKQIRSGDLKLPKAIFGIEPEYFTDWEPHDTLAIGRLQTYLLSYDADADISLQRFFDASRSTFAAGAADPLFEKRAGFEIDFFRFAPATDATTTTGYPTMMPMSAKPGKGPTSGPARGPGKNIPAASHAEIAASSARTALAKGYLDALKGVRDLLAAEGFGSNNWGIMPSKSATGHTLIASDPHLNLTAPSIFYPVSMEVKTDADSFKVGGVAFPGIPGIILGHNENVGWGATVAGYDVSDAYAEELSADGKSVKLDGADVPIEVIPEEIFVQGQAQPLVYEVLNVPHHGPIVPTITADHKVLPPDPEKGAISIKWTGLEATTEVAAVFELLRAKDVDEAYDAMRAFGVGAQNWMIGDTSGNVLWTSHALVPTRDKQAYTWDAATYQGTLPCFVLPGTGAAEWTGFLGDDLVPWVKNPAEGYVATANNDPIGDTLDNDPSNDTLPDGAPMFIGCTFDIGFREQQIQTRISTKSSLFTPEDIAAVQADHRSPMGARLAPRLIQAIDRAEEERTSPGSHPDLAGVVSDAAYVPETINAVRELLDAWDEVHDFSAESGVDPETNMPLDAAAPEAEAASATLVFNVWLVRALRRAFGDELGKVGYKSFFREVEAKAFLRLVEEDPAQLATFDMTTGDSAVWDDIDTPEVESRDDRMIRALLDAVTWIEGKNGGSFVAPWGAYHTIRFGALIPLWGDLSIPPSDDDTFPKGFPRHGDQFNVDNCDFALGVGLDQDPTFTYAHGPSQRFVIDLDPAGPKAWNAIPGGVIWDNTNGHFADEAELWRRNQSHEVPFAVDDVIANKESRTVVALPSSP